jgi:hypothetical protein
MLESPLRWLILVMLILVPVFILFTLWAHRLRAQKRARWEQELQKALPRFSEKRQRKGVPVEVSRALERVTRSVEGAVKSGKKTARVRLGKKFELRAVAPDVITVSGQGVTLYKSFERAKVKSVRKIRHGYEIQLRGT